MAAVLEGYNLGKLLAEGKTKQVYDLPDTPAQCAVVSKDVITAGNGVRCDALAGKATISNLTNAAVFQLLNELGIRTAFVKLAGDGAFIARKCQMIPIEWITRRLATGSFLKRNPGVPEKYTFTPPKHEMCLKDDANDDPLWSVEQIIASNWTFNGRRIGSAEVTYLQRTAVLVFEILERAWATRDCTLVDMKVEFGVDEHGTLLLADIIDSDSWRLWPAGDKHRQVDKQVYRELKQVTADALKEVKRNFEWVHKELEMLVQSPRQSQLAVIAMGSVTDASHCEIIRKELAGLGINTEVRVTSAHKGTEDTLQMVRGYEAKTDVQVVYIAVAGRSNGLGPVLAGNSAAPVINCPPVTAASVDKDIWSSLNVPSGLGCVTVMYPAAAALHVANIFALNDYKVWARLKVKQLDAMTVLSKADEASTSITPQ